MVVILFLHEQKIYRFANRETVFYLIIHLYDNKRIFNY